MKRTFAVLAAIGFATAASAGRHEPGTLTVYTTDAANVVRSTFEVGETILLKVDGDTGSDPFILLEDSILGELVYNGAITDTLGVTQGTWLTNIGALPFTEGSATVFSQYGPVTNPGVDTSVITLRAVAVGSSSVVFGGYIIDFFGIYAYGDCCMPVATGFSFSITPEPAPAALIGIGLFALVLGARRRACSERER